MATLFRNKFSCFISFNLLPLLINIFYWMTAIAVFCFTYFVDADMATLFKNIFVHKNSQTSFVWYPCWDNFWIYFINFNKVATLKNVNLKAFSKAQRYICKIFYLKLSVHKAKRRPCKLLSISINFSSFDTILHIIFFVTILPSLSSSLRYFTASSITQRQLF